jgi:hypothetical protein
MKYAAAAVFGLLCLPFLPADVPADSHFSTELILQGSSLPEAKAGVVQSFSIPLLRGNTFLTEGNNIKAAFSAELSPVSLNGTAELTWTPLAFFQLTAGGRAGSGWNIRLFGSELRGIGINRRRWDGRAETCGSAFNGLLWSLKSGGALQFDAAALFPGDWHHLLFRTYQEINYAAYTAASTDDSWYYENDEGENRNGFGYYGNYLLGYQMPIVLNMVGILAEMKKSLYTTANRELWGDDLARWILSGIFNFTITKRLSAALLAQFRTRRNFTALTKNFEFYQDRRIQDSRRQLEFYRIAAVFSFRLR